MYYDRQGNPLDDAQWLKLLEDSKSDYRRVEQTYVDHVRVSTVWLGLDHGYGDGRPLIFETMVVGLDTDDDPQWRYSTEDEARAGHWAAVKWVQDMLRKSRGEREDLIVPDDRRPLADVEPGSLDISGLDKAELLAALVNAAGRASPFARLTRFTQEHAAAIIQDNLGAGGGRPFDFDYVNGRPIKCDIGGTHISAFHVARYDRDAGAGTAASVVSELRAQHDQRQAERERRRAEHDEHL